MKLEPVGAKLIVLPLPKEEFKTEGGLDIPESDLDRGEVIEVSEEYSRLYKRGDVVIYAQRAGTETFYKGKIHLYLNGKAHTDNGDIWAIEKPDSE